MKTHWPFALLLFFVIACLAIEGCKSRQKKAKKETTETVIQQADDITRMLDSLDAVDFDSSEISEDSIK
jgi:hypothetical protein